MLLSLRNMTNGTANHSTIHSHGHQMPAIARSVTRTSVWCAVHGSGTEWLTGPLPSNYNAHRLDRNINGGGIMAAVRNCFTVDDVTLDQVTCEFMCVRIAIHKSSPLYVAAYYRPPDESATHLDHFEAALGQLHSKINKRGRSTLLVGGDFNVGGINWDALTTKVNARNMGTCKRMLDIVTDGGLSQFQKEPTRQGEVSQSTPAVFVFLSKL